MSTRTMTMYMNDFGINRERASPVLRVTKPAGHVFEAMMALSDALVDNAMRAAAGIAEWYRRQRCYAEWAQVDDHLLRDIGVTRDGRIGPVEPFGAVREHRPGPRDY